MILLTYNPFFISKNKNPMEGIKKVLIPLYKEYIIHLMIKMGSDKFEGYSVKFPDFIKWCKKRTKSTPSFSPHKPSL